MQRSNFNTSILSRKEAFSLTCVQELTRGWREERRRSQRGGRRNGVGSVSGFWTILAKKARGWECVYTAALF